MLTSIPKARGCECNMFCPPEGQWTVFGGVTEPLCFITFTFITMSPKRLRVRTSPGVRVIWIVGLLIRKWSQPATIHGVVWLSHYIYIYMLSSRSSILKLKCILPLLRAIPAPMGSVSSAEWRPKFTFQSFDRPQEAEQYKCLKGSLDSIPFHLFSFTQNLQTVFRISRRGLYLCGVAAVQPYSWLGSESIFCN